MRKRKKKKRKKKKIRTRKKERENPPPTPLKFRFMVADKLRSLRLSFAFIENRMALTALTTCQIRAVLLLLPLDFPCSLSVWGGGDLDTRKSSAPLHAQLTLTCPCFQLLSPS